METVALSIDTRLFVSGLSVLPLTFEYVKFGAALPELGTGYEVVLIR